MATAGGATGGNELSAELLSQVRSRVPTRSLLLGEGGCSERALQTTQENAVTEAY